MRRALCVYIYFNYASHAENSDYVMAIYWLKGTHMCNIRKPISCYGAIKVCNLPIIYRYGVTPLTTSISGSLDFMPLVYVRDCYVCYENEDIFGKGLMPAHLTSHMERI